MAWLRLIAPFVLIGCALPAFADRGMYLLHCGGCHLPDGRGTPPEVPSLRSELGHIASIREGRDYLVQVPGASQAPVTDAELARIINWILTEFSPSTLDSNFKPISEDEVARARAVTLADPLKRREEIWSTYVR